MQELISEFWPKYSEDRIQIALDHFQFRLKNTKCTYISGQLTSGLRAATNTYMLGREPGHVEGLRKQLNVDEMRFVRDVVQFKNPSSSARGSGVRSDFQWMVC